MPIVKRRVRKMADLITTFQDGRLLVSESRACESDYTVSGEPIRIGSIRTIDKVLSIDTDHSQYGLVTPLNEVRTSGNQIFVVMRRGDLGDTAITSGAPTSGSAAYDLMSGISSGLGHYAELLSGATISGIVTVEANVIGY